MPNYACHKYHLHLGGAHYLTKASCEISASSFRDFLSKGGKSFMYFMLHFIVYPTSF